MRDQITGAIRLAAAWFVGSVIVLAFEYAGVEFTDEMSSALTQAFTLSLSVAYYLAATTLTKHFPWAGWLLLIPKSPIYVPPENVKAARKQLNALR